MALNNAGTITDSIREAIQKEIKKVVAEETEVACRRVKERINATIDGFALRVLSHYNVSEMGNKIVIEVIKSPISYD